MKIKKRNRIIIIAAAVIITLLGVGVFAGYSVYNASKVMNDGNTKKIDIDQDVSNGLRNKGVYTFAVGGTDKGGTRTDTLMLVYFDTVHSKINILSLPRDTYIDTTSNNKKINSAYAVGKGDGLKDCIKKTFGIEVDGYVVISTKAFRDFVDGIGGVEVNVADDMNYDDKVQDLHIHIKKGLQVLKGEDAEGFVRFRHGYANGDLARIEAQKVFIAAMAKQAVKPSNLLNMSNILQTVFSDVKTDIAFSDMLKFGTDASKVDMANIKMFNAPGEAYFKNGVSYFTLYKNEMLGLLNSNF
ncbi:MAG: LCP family protein, partial [Bacillota bacterium]|nr:LCP family protein [Bacillota bacterium]